jgi:hypothetical protein
MHAKKKFYGDSKPDLKPKPNETAEDFKARGGIPGKFMGPNDANIVYRIDPKTGMGVFVDPSEEEGVVSAFANQY